MEGAKLAGLEALLALVYSPRTEDEEELDMVLDNKWSELSWWKWDLVIERRAKRHPDLSNRKLAAQLEFSHTRVNRALKIMAALNPAAREAITAHLASGGVLPPKSGTPGSTQGKAFILTEAHLEVLADLKDPLLAEKAVKTTLDRQLTGIPGPSTGGRGQGRTEARGGDGRAEAEKGEGQLEIDSPSTTGRTSGSNSS